jgi:hypothetical protein
MSESRFQPENSQMENRSDFKYVEYFTSTSSEMKPQTEKPNM